MKGDRRCEEKRRVSCEVEDEVGEKANERGWRPNATEQAMAEARIDARFTGERERDSQKRLSLGKAEIKRREPRRFERKKASKKSDWRRRGRGNGSV